MIAREEGIRGLYKGLGPALLTVPLFWSMYWCTYNRVKEVLLNEFPNTHVAAIHVVAAISAGALGDIITNPLWVTRTRIQTLIFHSESHLTADVSTVGMMRSIYKNEGIGAFYKGLGASFLGLSHVACQFPLYEYLKKLARERRNGEESVSMTAAIFL
jgi:solute carrier family 25 folate transporter 32